MSDRHPHTRLSGPPLSAAGDMSLPADQWDVVPVDSAADGDDDGAMVAFDPTVGAQLSPHQIAQRIGYANSLCVALAEGTASPRQIVEFARCLAEFAPRIAATGDVHDAICNVRDELRHLVDSAVSFQAANFDQQSTQFAVELTHNVQQMGALMLNQLKDSQDEQLNDFAQGMIARLNSFEGSAQSALAVFQSANAEQQDRLRQELGQLVALKNEQLTAAFMQSVEQVQRDMKGAAEEQQLMNLRVDAKLAAMEALALDAVHRVAAESQAETDKRIAEHSITLLKSSQAMVAQVSTHAREHTDNVAKVQAENQKLALTSLARQMQSALETESVDTRALVLQQANAALEEVANHSRNYVDAIAKRQAAAMAAHHTRISQHVDEALAIQRVENLTQHIETKAHTDQKTHEVFTKTLDVVHGVTTTTANAHQARLSGLTDTVQKIDSELTGVRTTLDEVQRSLAEHEKRTASILTVTKLTTQVTSAETGLRDVSQRLTAVESTCGSNSGEIALLRDAVDSLTTLLSVLQEELRAKDHFTYEMQREKSLQRSAASALIPPAAPTTAPPRATAAQPAVATTAAQPQVAPANVAPSVPATAIPPAHHSDGLHYRPGACLRRL